MAEFTNMASMRNFIRSCFETLTQFGFTEVVTKLNLYFVPALLKVFFYYSFLQVVLMLRTASVEVLEYVTALLQVFVWPPEISLQAAVPCNSAGFKRCVTAAFCMLTKRADFQHTDVPLSYVIFKSMYQGGSSVRETYVVY